MLNIKVLTWSLGAFGAVTFVLCVLYGLVAPESPHMEPSPRGRVVPPERPRFVSRGPMALRLGPTSAACAGPRLRTHTTRAEAPLGECVWTEVRGPGMLQG